ncbi:MAG TPA: hypothetical protein VE172_06015, partial [Stackebrandtia sp.]|nr:hypothetical protein [Stackebrandtia sp.]
LRTQGTAALWHWYGLAAIGLIAVGGLLVQNAYRSGHFGLAFATLLIADPVVAATSGVVALSEPLPSNALDVFLAVASVVVTTVGVAVLARHTGPPESTLDASDSPERSSTPQPDTLKEIRHVHSDLNCARP